MCTVFKWWTDYAQSLRIMYDKDQCSFVFLLKIFLHDKEQLSELLLFWQRKQLQSEVCWLLSKYSFLFHKGSWQTVETLTKVNTKKVPLVSRKDMSCLSNSPGISSQSPFTICYLKRCIEIHNVFFLKTSEIFIHLWANVLLLSL